MVEGEVALGAPSRRTSSVGRSPGGSSMGRSRRRSRTSSAVTLRLVRSDEPGAGSDRGSDGSVSLVSTGHARPARAGGRARRRSTAVGSGCSSRSRASQSTRKTAGSVAPSRSATRSCRSQEVVGRCAVTTHDPDTGVPDLDTLRILARYRPRRQRGAAADRCLGAASSSRAPCASATRCSRSDDRSCNRRSEPSSSRSATSTRRPRSTARRSACARSGARATPSSSEPRAMAPRSSRSSHRPDAPVRPPRTTGLFHLALLVPSRADLARAVHRVHGCGVEVHRRGRPPRLRGALPRRPGRQRDRDLPRPAAGGVGDRERRAEDGDVAPRPRGRPRRASKTATWATGWRAARASGTSTFRSRTCREPRRSTSTRSASSRSCAPTRVRCSCRPAATTTISGSTPGPAWAQPAPPEGARGLRSFSVRAPGR